jgi:signal transduction histidine kinase
MAGATDRFQMASLPDGAALAITAWSAPYFASASFSAVVGAIILFRGRGPEELRAGTLRLYLTFAAILLCTGLIVSAHNAAGATGLARLVVAVSLLAPSAALGFAAPLLGRPLTVLRQIAWATTLPTAALTVTTPLVVKGARLTAFGCSPTPGLLYPLAVLPLSLALVVPVLLLLHLRVERRPREREQLVVVLISSWIAGLILVDLLPVVGFPTPPLGWLPALVAMMGMTAAIVLHRLIDIGLALRRSLVWIGLTLLGALPFVALVWLLRPRLGHSGPLPLSLLFIAVAVGMRVYLAWVQPRVERMFGRRRRDLDAELAWLGNRAGTLLTTEELGRAIDRFLSALDRRLAALVVVEPTGRPRVALSAWGSVPSPSRASPLLAELQSARTLVSRDRASGPARVEIERACVRWGAEYLGPLVEGERLLGIVAVSPRQGGGLADAIELEALERLCLVVTSALAGARLYERLRGLSSELEQKAAARSAALAKALRELRGAEQRLVQGEKLASLGQIVAGVAADLRDRVHDAFAGVARLRQQVDTVLAAARALPLARDEKFEEMARDVRPLCDAISEGARRAYAIAQDLSGFAPSDATDDPSQGSHVAARRPAHLAALLDTTLTLCTPHLRDVGVVRDYDETLPALPVEAGPLGQVILNLILNATQAMRGSGTLTLATRRVGDQAELSVGDTGPGIAPDVLPRIFEPFFSTKGPTTGTGLGLSISYGIVKRHNGQIRVDSKLGIGTTFRVQIPITER